ncbi:helix-turn-helix domain-containing protein [Lysobacter sp. 1R34A]|uniref:helix-turn-helix domain-containing protein n=1 Tax=Lysobacter sp. 1R34A TaxID=3445786 RepID=UPI003EEE44FD
MNAIRPLGELLRDWRERRGLSQSNLAELAATSARHMSFIETGRSQPSRAMLIRLADRLEVPPRERNALMRAAGWSALHPERCLRDDPALAQAREAVGLVLRGHEPYPALAMDRHWNLLARNGASGALYDDGIAAFLLRPPINLLRLSLHPQGLAPRILNLGPWRAQLLQRLRRQADFAADPVLDALHAELSDYPGPASDTVASTGFAMPMRLRAPCGVLSFVSVTTLFKAPVDLALCELAIETLLPADRATAQSLRSAWLSRRGPQPRWQPEPPPCPQPEPNSKSDSEPDRDSG